MTSASLLDFNFTGFCSETTAFLLIATPNNDVGGLTFNDTLNVSESIFGVRDIGVILNQEEFDLVSSLNNIADVESFWLGLEFDGDDFRSGLFLDEREANTGFSFINDNFTDQSFFENLREAPWESGLINDIIDDFEDLSEFNRVIFQKTFENDDSDSDFGFFTFFGDGSSDDEDDILPDTWTIIDESDPIPGFLFREENSSRCYNQDIRFDIEFDDENLLIAPFNSGNGNFTDAQLLCEELGSILIDFESIEELAFVLASLLFESDPSSSSEYWTGITFNSTSELDAFAEKFGLTDAFEDVELEEDDFDNSQVFALVLNRIFGQVILDFSLVDDLSDKTGAICRENDDEINRNVDNNVFAVIGIIGLLLILIILLVVFNKKMSKKSTQTKPQAGKQLVDQPTVIINSKPSLPNKMTVDKQPEDAFSILSTISDINSTRSLGAMSIVSVDTVHSKKTEISAADADNDLRIKSIISNRSEFSRMSRRLLRVEPFVNDINNESELLSFYGKVESFLAAQIKQDETRVERNQAFMHFDALAIPNISLSMYVARLVNGMNLWFNDEGTELDEFVGIRSLLLGLHLIRKANVNHPLTNYNIHKVLSVAMLVSAKFVEDEIITNDFWADMAGITFEEMNSLERIFCFDLGFNFDIEEAEIKQSLRTLELTQLL